MCVFTFGDSGVQQTGKFIDEGGNDFWGVEVFTTPQGERLFAGSDRGLGLYLLRYTGPGARPRLRCRRWWWRCRRWCWRCRPWWRRSVAGCVEGDGLREPDQGDQGA